MKIALALFLVFGLPCANAQLDASSSLPDAPSLVASSSQPPQAVPAPADPSRPKFGQPNTPKPAPVPIAGDSIFAPLATPGPYTLKIRTEDYMVITFGPRAFISPLFSVARLAVFPNRKYPTEWKYGPGAIGRQYGSALGARISSQSARYATGALLHEDFRYRPSTETGGARLVHAIGYTFVDSSDSGHRRIAVANFADAAAGSFVPLLWLPDGFNTRGDGARHFGTRMGGIAINNVLREFSPDIFQFIGHHHIPHIPIPVWWTKDPRITRVNHP